jgi:hypothetical protein
VRLFGPGLLELELDRGELTPEEYEKLDVDAFFENVYGRWEREQFEAGHKTILLFYLYKLICARKRAAPGRIEASTVAMPEWVAEAICSACEKVYGFEVESWDEVFGRTLKKGGRLSAERRNLKIKYRV